MSSFYTSDGKFLSVMEGVCFCDCTHLHSRGLYFLLKFTHRYWPVAIPQACLNDQIRLIRHAMVAAPSATITETPACPVSCSSYCWFSWYLVEREQWVLLYWELSAAWSSTSWSVQFLTESLGFCFVKVGVCFWDLWTPHLHPGWMERRVVSPSSTRRQLQDLL